MMDQFRLNLYEKKKRGLYCDVTLVAALDNQKILAHRVVLYAASEYFETLLTSDLTEQNSNGIPIGAVSGHILRLLVDYCYTQQIDINATNAYDMMAAAHMFGFTDVVQTCATVCAKAIDATDVLDIWEDARIYELFELQKAVRVFMQHHFVEITQEEPFLELDADKLADYLAWDGILVNSEKDVYNAIVKWIEHDRSGRKQHFGRLMKALQMSRIDIKFLNGTIQQYADELQMRNVFDDAHKEKLKQRENLTDVERSPYFQYLYAAGQPDDLNYALVSRYSIISNRWEDLQQIPEMRSCHINRIADRLYLIEMNGSHEGNQFMSLSLSTMESERRMTSTIGRKEFSTVTNGKYVYVIGGQDWRKARVRALASVERYDTTTGDWEQITALTHRRHNSAGVVLDGFVYVVGGSSECPLQSVERYNPRTKSWSMVGNLKVPRSHHRCCSVNGSIYAVGGKRNLASIEKYDKQIDTWTVMRVELAVPRFNFGIGVVGEWFHIVGGEKEPRNPVSVFMQPSNLRSAHDSSDESQSEDVLPVEKPLNGLKRINAANGKVERLATMGHRMLHCVMTQ